MHKRDICVRNDEGLYGADEVNALKKKEQEEEEEKIDCCQKLWAKLY